MKYFSGVKKNEVMTKTDININLYVEWKKINLEK